MSERAEIQIESIADLTAWLRAHHGQREAVWLVTFKKAAGDRHVPYDRIVEELLAWGWVDSKPGKVDDLRSKVLIAPRKPGSAWSKANRDRVAMLEKAGRLQPSGRAVIDQAKASGAWSHLEKAETGRAPAPLAAALRADGAWKGWQGLSLATRKRALEWLYAAKTDPTRDKRIAQIVASAKAGEDPTAWKPKL